MSHPASIIGSSRRAVIGLAAGALVVLLVGLMSPAVGTVAVADTPPTPGAPPATGGPSAGASPSPVPGGALFPLPPEVTTLPPGVTTVSLEPTSGQGVPVGSPIPYSLGHCGLHSPVDIDGSLWKPVAGHDATGAPIEGDAEVGELINATEGLLTLVDAERAEFRTWAGTLIAFERAPGALAYPLCM